MLNITIKLITNNMNNYDKLISIQKEYPELTFQNAGYEYLSKEITDRHKEQIEEISKILKDAIPGFVKFNNFYIIKNGDITIRCQYYYDKMFVGVGYFNIEEFKETDNNLNK